MDTSSPKLIVKEMLYASLLSKGENPLDIFSCFLFFLFFLQNIFTTLIIVDPCDKIRLSCDSQ